MLDATWHNPLPNQLSNINSPSLTLLQFIPRARPAVTPCLPFLDISRVESTGSINTTFDNMQLCVFLPYGLALLSLPSPFGKPIPLLTFLESLPSLIPFSIHTFVPLYVRTPTIYSMGVFFSNNAPIYSMGVLFSNNAFSSLCARHRLFIK